jgi:heme A synthase
MLARRLASLLAICTFSLVLLGGVVHSTGSSLACPDWPLCYGQVFPRMQGGVLYEHGHRLLAGAVACLTAAITALLWNQANRPLRLLCLLGCALVLLQATLGGLTVIFRLPPTISIAHLATSMVFFAWTMVLNYRLRAAHWAPLGPLGPNLQRPAALAASVVYLQLVMGAVVRHNGASMTCGYDALRCAGAWLPQNDLQWLQTSHRALAFVVLAAVIKATLKPLRQARLQRRAWVRPLGIAAHVLVLLQIVLGVLVLKTGVNLHVVTTHLALGALLWADMVAFTLCLGATPSAQGAAERTAPHATAAFVAATGGLAGPPCGLDGAR